MAQSACCNAAWHICPVCDLHICSACQNFNLFTGLVHHGGHITRERRYVYLGADSHEWDQLTLHI